LENKINATVVEESLRQTTTTKNHSLPNSQANIVLEGEQGLQLFSQVDSFEGEKLRAFLQANCEKINLLTIMDPNGNTLL